MHASGIFTTASLMAVATAVARDPFTLDIPKAIGLQDLQTSTAICNSFDLKDRSKVTEWPVSGHAVAVTTNHEYAVWKYSVALADDLTTWVPLIGEVEQAGVGSFCLDGLPVSHEWINKDALLRVEQHTSHSGIFYQCAAITFVEGPSATVQHGCYNDSDIALARLPAKRAAGVAIHDVSYPQLPEYSQQIQGYPTATEPASYSTSSFAAPGLAGSFTPGEESSTEDAEPASATGSLTLTFTLSTAVSPTESSSSSADAAAASSAEATSAEATSDAGATSSSADAAAASSAEATSAEATSAEATSDAGATSSSADAAAGSSAEPTSAAEPTSSPAEPTSTPDASASDVEPAETDEPTAAASSTADAVSGGATSTAEPPTVTAGSNAAAKAPSALVVGVFVGALLF